MNIALVTTAYNGYGRFADQWLGFIAEMDPKPTRVVIALGPDHGLTPTDLSNLYEKYSEILPDTCFVMVPNEKPLMGPMRNWAVRSAHTEWVMYMSIDDKIYPWAIKEFEKYENDADYISISWDSENMWQRNSNTTLHKAKTPQEMAELYHGKGFIIGHSPFRRSFWEKHPYADHDYPNAPFVADMVESGARFVKTEIPCTCYLRRLDSHAARLGRRRGTLDPKEKSQANRWKNNMQRRIKKYYGVK